MFENKVLKEIFGPKGEEVSGDWRRLHNEELHDLYASLYIIRVMKSRRMRWVGRAVRMGEMRNAYKILVGKSEGERPFGRSRRRLEDNIRMDLTGIGWEVLNWIHLAQDVDQWRILVNTVMNLRVVYNFLTK
jgi:hypothetical protein